MDVDSDANDLNQSNEPNNNTTNNVDSQQSPETEDKNVIDTQEEEKKEDEQEDATEIADLDRLNEITIWKGKWNKTEYAVYFDRVTRIIDLKEQLEDETGVRKEKIKLVGIKWKKEFRDINNNKITDQTLVHHLELKSKKKGFIMIGTLDKNAFKVQFLFFHCV